MSATAAVTRLATMDGEELRFRLACEARKIAGRVRHVVRPTQLVRVQLGRILDPTAGELVANAIRDSRRGHHLAAHRALAAHFATRKSCWPLQAANRQAFVATLADEFPDSADDVRQRADRIIAGRHDLLGYRDVQVGNPPDWHADPVHGRRAPRRHWTRVPYLDPAVGDHKVIWEINRHQYFLTLGTAYWLTGERRYRDVAIAHLQDWLAQNPPLEGINWTSMLELAFRAMSWTWAVEFFAAEASRDEVPWLVDLLLALDAQLTHVSQNLSRYFSPNTHLTGEALALYAVSTALPELGRSPSRRSEGRDVLLAEIERQIRADGGHVELSSHYHHYTTDFYLLALMIARAAGDPAAARFEEAARRTAGYLRTLADDGGEVPLIGDDDGGQLFRFGTRGASDASATLAVAASLLHDPSLAVAPVGEDEWWILGRRPDHRPMTTSPWGSRVLRESGYVVSRTGDDGQLIFDAGPHGFLNGGHAHSDALAVVLHVAGSPVLVDPGTATYVMDKGLRDRLRSARMHNTVTLDGREHAIPRGPFHWDRRTDARLLVATTGAALDFAVGMHSGYGRHQHTRAVVTLHGIGWLVVDRITGEDDTAADAWWHVHPAWRATLSQRSVTLRRDDGRRLGLVTTAPDVAIVSDPASTEYAPEYGRVERSTTIRARSAGPVPRVIGTFVSSSAELTEPLTIVELRAAPAQIGWVRCEFAISTGDRDIRAAMFLPSDPHASVPADSWPQPCIDQLPKSCVE